MGGAGGKENGSPFGWGGLVRGVSGLGAGNALYSSKPEAKPVQQGSRCEPE